MQASSFLGEYFLDATDGTSWFQSILGKSSRDIAEESSAFSPQSDCWRSTRLIWRAIPESAHAPYILRRLVVVFKLTGEFHIRCFRTHPYKHLESLSGDGRKDRINTEDDDGIFEVILNMVNDMRTMEFDDNPGM
ncbi:hypothetical protein SMZ63_002480 [Cronobacter sakazakii]|nr:hypothetical protein [Cronobacter sakazakii]ELY4455915.1 hypothetical protein [Cronobacter sakazakii]